MLIFNVEKEWRATGQKSLSKKCRATGQKNLFKNGERQVQKNLFKKGITDGLAICIGYFSVSFAFGVFAVSNGLSVVEAVLISMTNLTSAGQLAAVPIICTGSGLIELALSQLVINSRYLFMSASLSQRLSSKMTVIQRLMVSFGNTDEIFAVAMSNGTQLEAQYMYGLILTPFLGWTIGTLAGAVAGNILPGIIVSALGVAIYGMLTAVVLPQIKKSKSMALCALIAIVLGCCFEYIPYLNGLPGGFAVIISAVAAALVMAAAAPVNVSEEGDICD